VAAAEEQRRALVLVVARGAERAARHPHRAGAGALGQEREEVDLGGGWGLRAEEEE
jgi:hypothetical protein